MYVALLMVQYLSVFLLMLEAGYIFVKMNTRLHNILFLYCIATLVNNAGYIIIMKSGNPDAFLFGLQISYLGKVWIPFALLLFAVRLTKQKISSKVFGFLGVIHAFIYVMVLTSEYHELYYKNRVFHEDGLFPHLTSEGGIFHKLYTLLMILYIIYGLFILIRATINEVNEISKKRLWLITWAVAVQCIFYIIQLTGITAEYDTTVMGYSISTVIMYVALFRYDLMNTLQLAKDYVVDEVSEGIIAVSKEGFVEYFNNTAKNILPDLSLDKSFDYNEIVSAAEKDGGIEINGRIYSPEVKPLIHNGLTQGSVYVLVDDTEHYRYLKELKEQKDIAEAANASKSAFLSIVTHEIRTPMNAVVGMTDLLLRDEDELSSKQEKYLKNIKNSGAALVMIVNDILDQSKIEAGKMEIVEEAYELRPMLDDVKLIIENRIGSKPVHLSIDVDDAIPHYLVGDSLRIRQILINLMNNAVKFTEEGYIALSIAAVTTEEKRQALKFSIKDSGQGIRAEDLSKLGQAFAQVDTKKNHDKEGTGLGLSISRDFIALMGGQLEVESEYGKGTEFFFTIWQGIADNIEANESRKQAWQEEAKFTAPDAKILVVDDTDLNLIIIGELLKPLNMHIDKAKSGEAAIEMIKDNKYDVVFMDYMMPKMSGVETTEKIRGLCTSYENDPEMAEYLKSVPIIALSGDNSENTKEEFLRAGIDDFTEKPVSIKQLKKILIKWLPENKIKGE